MRSSREMSLAGLVSISWRNPRMSKYERIERVYLTVRGFWCPYRSSHVGAPMRPILALIVGYISVSYKDSGFKDILTLSEVALGAFAWDMAVGRLVLLLR